MEDYLIHRDKERRERFLKRFEKLFNKFKNDYNRPIFWAVNLLW
jgi:vacuolar-type H+-ATPase subunit B/Vma2